MKFFFPLALALGSFTAVAQIPAALTTDPPASRADPATMGDLAIPSHGAMMNGIIYIAGGAGPHPTVLASPVAPTAMRRNTATWSSTRPATSTEPRSPAAAQGTALSSS